MTPQLGVVCVCICDAVSPTQTFFWISDTFIADNFLGWNLCLNKLNGKELLIVDGKNKCHQQRFWTHDAAKLSIAKYKPQEIYSPWKLDQNPLSNSMSVNLFVCFVVWKLCPSKLDRRKMKAQGIFLPLKNGSQHPLCFFPERSERRRRPKSWSSRLLPSRPTMSSHVQHADWISDPGYRSRRGI